MTISMGQGKEEVSLEALAKAARDGTWVFLQNIHLMGNWLQRLERLIEDLGASSHEEFRCFLSAEPPPLPYMKTIPEGLLQKCVKVANEASADLKSNLQRAWASFDEDRI